MSERVTLRLLCSELDDSKLFSLTRDLRKSLSEKGLEATLPSGREDDPTKKGVSLDLNAIVLALIGSGGVAVGLIQVLRSYVERKSTLHFEVVRRDGEKLLLTGENLSDQQQKTTTRLMDTFLKS